MAAAASLTRHFLKKEKKHGTFCRLGILPRQSRFFRSVAAADGGMRAAGGNEVYMSDEAWMAACANGRRKGASPAERAAATEAFEHLFRLYQQPLYGFFLRRTGDSGPAEELTQECFLAVFKAVGRYRPTASFRTFLYAIGLNLVRAHRRKTIFRAMFAGEAKAEAGADSHAELSLVVKDALAHLDRTDREMIMLRVYDDLSYAEIAELLGVPVGTVRSRLFRARAALRELLATAPAKAANLVVQQGERA